LKNREGEKRYHYLFHFSRFLKENGDGKAKNLSPKNMWTVAFLLGKDDEKLARENLADTFDVFQKLEGRPLENGKKLTVVMPCDMVTHDELTKAAHLTCFRCGTPHGEFRTIFVVVIVNGKSLRDLAEEQGAFVQDLLRINQEGNVRSLLMTK